MCDFIMYILDALDDRQLMGKINCPTILMMDHGNTEASSYIQERKEWRTNCLYALKQTKCPTNFMDLLHGCNKANSTSSQSLHCIQLLHPHNSNVEIDGKALYVTCIHPHWSYHLLKTIIDSLHSFQPMFLNICYYYIYRFQCSHSIAINSLF